MLVSLSFQSNLSIPVHRNMQTNQQQTWSGTSRGELVSSSASRRRTQFFVVVPAKSLLAPTRRRSSLSLWCIYRHRLRFSKTTQENLDCPFCPMSLTDCVLMQIKIMSLLDLTAAFDTLDHQILVNRLQTTFDISGSPVKWFSSYLSGRCQSVVCNHMSSKPLTLKYGVPQGSVLGPVLFTFYTHPLSDVIKQHDCDYHKYTDDTQPEDDVPPCDVPLGLDRLRQCIDSVQRWMLVTS